MSKLNRRDVSMVLLTAGVAAGFIGCAGCRTDDGEIYISHPQVFTRERLVTAREKELQFLENSLNMQVQSAFSGAQDLRSLSALQDSLALTASPTAGAKVASASPSALSDASKLMPGGAGSMDTAKSVSVSAVDHFNDVMAYRDAVNAVIREKELDDMHDREGKTLYTLKFDTALIPGDNERRPALVKITIEPSELEDVGGIYRLWLQYLEARREGDENAIESRFRRGQITAADESLWTYLKAGVEDICRSATNSLSGTNLTRAVEQIKAGALFTVVVLAMPQESRREYVTKIINMNPDLAKPDFNQIRQRSQLLTGMEIALNAKYCRDFAGLVSVKYDFDALGLGELAIRGCLVPYSPSADPGSNWWSNSEWKNKRRPADGAVQFENLLRVWTNQAYVDSIDPQIYAQNLSEVSSRTKLLELALTLNAAVAQPASLANTANYLHESEALLQSIKRQPLALGFCSGTAGADNAEFGWLLGPPFDIKDGKAAFTQTATRQSFSVSIVAPAWWQELKLTARRCWLGVDGRPVRGSEVTNAIKGVALPCDMDALTSAIQRRSARLGPTLYMAGEALQAGTNGDQTLMILGSELWRNPAVIVGSTPADTVDLLPDMHGLIAHFKAIPAIYSEPADLTVVTSFGADRLDKAVKIISPVKSATNQPQAKLTNSFAVYNGQRLGFTLASMPSAFAGFSIKLGAKDAPGKWQSLADSGYELSTNRTSLTIPIAPDPLPAAPTNYALDVGLRLTPSGAPHSLFGTNAVSFLFFPAKDQEKPRVAPTELAYGAAGPSGPYVTLSPGPNATKQQLYQAYPGLEESVTRRTATLVLLQKATNIKSQPLPVTDAAGTGWTASTAALTSALPAAAYDAFALGYHTANGEPATIECVGGPVTVTGH